MRRGAVAEYAGRGERRCRLLGSPVLEERGEVIVDRLAHASEIARFTAMWCAGPRCRTRHLGQVPSVPMARAGFISGQSSVNGHAGFGLWGDDVAPEREGVE